MFKRVMGRRGFLGAATVATAATVLAACQPKIVETLKEVTKVVEVEKVVKETVIVEGTPKVVEKVVKETVIVKEEVKPTAAPQGPQKVLYGTYGSAASFEFVAWQLEKFHAEQDEIVVETQPVVGDRKQHYLTVFAAGVGPDCFISLEDMAREFATKGVAAPLDEYMDRIGGSRDRWIWDLLKPFVVKGQLCGLPYGWGADSINFFNAELFEAAGIESPVDAEKAGKWTWDQLRETAKELTLKDSSGLPTQYGFTWASGKYNYYPVMLAYGGAFFDEKQTKFVATEEGATKGIQVWADIRNVDKSGPIEISGQALPTFASFPGGGVGLSHQGFWYCGYLLGAELPFKWDISLPPTGDVAKGCTGGSGGDLVYSQSKAKEAAFNFIWWRSSDEIQEETLRRGANMSPLKAIHPRMAELCQGDLNWTAAVDLVNHFTQRPYRVGLSEVWTKYIQPALDEVTQGIKTAEEAMNGIADKVNEALAALTDEI